jgi:ABC-2 type transport system ATP-binding protein
VLLLDEPVSALDPVGRLEVLELIERLRSSCTVLLCSHILADVERVCDSVAIIDQGRLLVQARQQELLARYALPLLEIVSEPSPAFAPWLANLRTNPWLDTFTTTDTEVRLSVNDLEAAKRELLPSALQAGLVLTRYQVVTPTLEDVFMRLVKPQAQEEAAR